MFSARLPGLELWSDADYDVVFTTIIQNREKIN